MEHLELVIENLEDRVNEALISLSPPGNPVSLGSSLFAVTAASKDKYKEEKDNNGGNPHAP